MAHRRPGVVRELPWLLLLALIGLLTLGWQAAVVNVAVLLAVVLGFRVWARRRYGVGGNRAAEAP
ncbi:hypothetical protein [Geodermatophilus sp. SYSU D00696]